MARTTSTCAEDDICLYAVQRHPSDSHAAFSEANRLQGLRRAVSDVNRRIREAERAREEAFAKLAKELADIQAGCGHEMQKYHPDPSGNNDSWRECLICGAMI